VVFVAVVFVVVIFVAVIFDAVCLSLFVCALQLTASSSSTIAFSAHFNNYNDEPSCLAFADLRADSFERSQGSLP
jgi:hypothetical protein